MRTQCKSMVLPRISINPPMYLQTHTMTIVAGCDTEGVPTQTKTQLQPRTTHLEQMTGLPQRTEWIAYNSYTDHPFQESTTTPARAWTPTTGTHQMTQTNSTNIYIDPRDFSLPSDK